MNQEQKKIAKEAIDRALAIAGSSTKLAALITPYKPCSRQLVHHWGKRGAIGPSFVQAAVQALDGLIQEHEFRPEIFKKEA